MTPTAEQWERGQNILAGCETFIFENDWTLEMFESTLSCEDDWLALACALLTSPVKAEREQGKALVRDWKRAGVSHAKPDAID